MRVVNNISNLHPDTVREYWNVNCGNMIIKTALFVFAITGAVVTPGCIAGYQHYVRATLVDPGESRQQVIAIADEVAKESGLKPDPKISASPDVRGYFGRPYHYYTLTLKDAPDKSLWIEYLHDARLSNPKRPLNGPEELFFHKLVDAFGERLRGQSSENTISKKQAVEIAKREIASGNPLGFTDEEKPDPSRVIAVDPCKEPVTGLLNPMGPTQTTIVPCYIVRFRYMKDSKILAINPFSYDVKIDAITGYVIKSGRELHK